MSYRQARRRRRQEDALKPFAHSLTAVEIRKKLSSLKHRLGELCLKTMMSGEKITGCACCIRNAGRAWYYREAESIARGHDEIEEEIQALSGPSPRLSRFFPSSSPAAKTVDEFGGCLESKGEPWMHGHV
jgi:hypothetical protein